jgi:PhnB protein
MRTVPYLIFNGNCEEALTFYKSALGGEVSIMRFSEMPPNDEMPISDSWKEKIMHAELKLGEGQTIYLSDVFEGSSAKVGDNVTVHIDVDAKKDVSRLLDGLSEGATITMPVEEQFWGAVYGSLIDKFGVGWGFHFQIEE